MVPGFAPAETREVSHRPAAASEPRVAFAAVAEMIAWAAFACILTLINRFASLVVPLPPPGSLAGNLLAIVYLAGLLLALLHTARVAVSLPLRTRFLVAVGLVLSLPSLLIVFATLTKTDSPLLRVFYSILPMPLQAFLNNFLGPIGLSFLGAAIGRLIKHPNTLIAGAGFAIFFDIVVVTMGTVAQLMKSGSNLIAAVSVGAGAQIPAGPGGGPIIKLPDPISSVTIGPADVLFIALFLSSVYMMGLSKRATFAWMYVLLLGALVVVQTNFLPSWLPGIPALVPMGVAVLVANFRHAAFTRTERRDLVIGCIFAVFCACLMILWARRNITPPPPPHGLMMSRVGSATGPIYVVRIQRQSAAARAGIRPGDMLVAVNGASVRNLTAEEFEAQWAEANKPGGKGLVLRIQRRGNPQPLEFTLRADVGAAEAAR
jgi:hypothetical protein